ncbi:MAG: methyltransferase [Gammaproteobacteria bacterium]|nr:methyltransferase [Gammaproteobacteria bacterium]MDH3468477.1 methyltransferase [Gammaproteobacteria bacterium]
MKHLIRRILNRLFHIFDFEMPVRFGSLRRVTPISRSFGIDRGNPIDRYYIESFLEKHRHDIRGRVLEAGGYVNYTKQFGDNRVTQGDILYPKDGHPDGTIIGDLATGRGVPLDVFDCLILTQVFPFIYDLRAAVLNSYRSLKEGGVLLATLPGISQICRYDMEQWGDYWRFTDISTRQLFGDVFQSENVTVEVYGNVLVACAFLHGLPSREFTRQELDYIDPDYQLSITVRAVKAPKNGSVLSDSGKTG